MDIHIVKNEVVGTPLRDDTLLLIGTFAMKALCTFLSNALVNVLFLLARLFLIPQYILSRSTYSRSLRDLLRSRPSLNPILYDCFRHSVFLGKSDQAPNLLLRGRYPMNENFRSSKVTVTNKREVERKRNCRRWLDRFAIVSEYSLLFLRISDLRSVTYERHFCFELLFGITRNCEYFNKLHSFTELLWLVLLLNILTGENAIITLFYFSKIKSQLKIFVIWILPFMKTLQTRNFGKNVALFIKM